MEKKLWREKAVHRINNNLPANEHREFNGQSMHSDDDIRNYPH